MKTPTKIKEFTPGIMSLLPMIYVGWSDSVLSPSEIKLIQGQIQSLEMITSADKAYLTAVIDPANRPESAVFKSWLNTIKNWSRDLEINERSSLLDLGIAIAQSGLGEEDISKWKSPSTRKALADIQKALGLNDHASSSILMDRLSPVEEATGPITDTDQVRRLKNDLDGPYADLKESLRLLLRDPLFSLVHEPLKERHRERVLTQVRALAAQGLSAYAFPTTYGGKDDVGAAITVFEMLSYGDLSTTIKFGVQFGLFGGALFQLGTEKHHRLYLEAMIKGDLLGCFAMTETGHGSNVKDLETTATYDSRTHTLVIHSPSVSSGKEYIGNAKDCSLAVVFAQLIVAGTNHGIHAILVPIRDKNGQLFRGIKFQDSGYKMGLNGVDNGRFWFDQVIVPVDNLLDRFGSIETSGQYQSSIANPSKRFFTMLGTLVMGRISVGLASVSAAKKALTIAIRYSLKRRQFGPSPDVPESIIMDYPTHQLRLYPLLASVYAFHFALQDLLLLYKHSDATEHRHIETLAAGLKSKASWMCTRCIQEAREATGGKGYLQENQLADLKADADIFTTFEGDNTVLMQLVSKALLTEFKEAFHEEGTRAVIRFLMKRAKLSLAEMNPLHKRNTDYEHLISEEFITYSFDYRYQKMLISLGQRMRKFLKQGLSPYQAFLKTQIHLMDVADAYIDLHVLNIFLRHVQETKDVDLRDLKQLLWQIYGLDTLYRHRGWYLENDYMEGNKSKAIRRARTKLFQRLTPRLRILVEAFGIPDDLIAAPIAL